MPASRVAIHIDPPAFGAYKRHSHSVHSLKKLRSNPLKLQPHCSLNGIAKDIVVE